MDFFKNKFILLFFIGALFPSKIYAGELFVTPISQALVNEEKASLTLINISKDTGYFSYMPTCTIDNEHFSGSDCEKYFLFDLSSNILRDKNTLSIPPNTQVKKDIILKRKPENGKPFYALFSPIFTVINNQSNKKDTVKFEFRFAPGILFAYNPQKENLSSPSFSTFINKKNIRNVRFEFDLSNLKYPQVVTLNAKIIDRKTKKMIRFVDLSRDKIIDPKRKKLIVYEEIDENKGDEKSLCYVMYVIEKLTKSVYKLQDKC